MLATHVRKMAAVNATTLDTEFQTDRLALASFHNNPSDFQSLDRNPLDNVPKSLFSAAGRKAGSFAVPRARRGIAHLRAGRSGAS